MTKLSVLDLAPVAQGSDVGETLARSAELAQRCESLGYQRYWIAEHHNMPGIASAATALVIQHVAAATSRIRVGAGGIMLPNHAPLIIAEQFGTLASLYPGRIDLGVGRAPGTDPATARALRRNLHADVEQFPQDVVELLNYFDGDPQAMVRAIPGVGLDIPVWVLGSSLFGAQLAAQLGLPYAFASHFAPGQLQQAIALYRQQFTPSKYLDAPYAMAGFNVFAAPEQSEAEYLASSMQQAFVNLRRGTPGQLPPPIPNYLDQLAAPERALIQSVMNCSAIGDAQTIAQQTRQFIEENNVDELIISCQMHSHDARVRSYEILATALADCV